MADVEIKLDKNTIIVSETNEKGKILYANEDFCKISGYTKDELIGRPHNIVRHPDMPRVAFKELWDTIQAKEIWQGIVKNKTKDGNYYWVNAKIYPVKQKNGKLKFISVRVKPTQEEISYASNLYKTLH